MKGPAPTPNETHEIPDAIVAKKSDRKFYLVETGRLSMSRLVWGFTLIEILVAIALIAAMAAVAFTAYNPAGQLAQARNRARQLNLQTLMNVVRENSADQNKGHFSLLCGGSSVLIPTSTAKMSSVSPGYDIAACLIPTYLFALPFDPSASGAHYTSNSDYDTGYTIVVNSSTGQITLSAPATELATSAISVMR